MTWVPRSSRGMTRKENRVVWGPGHGVTVFSLLFFFIVIPAQAGIHCAAGICVAFATSFITWGPWSASTREN